VEFAMLKTPDGRLVPRTEAERSYAAFKNALARRGGRAPIGPDGRAMLWGAHCGWIPRRGASAPRALGRPLAVLQARQDQVNREIKQAAVNAQLQPANDLVSGASRLAWKWARSYAAGAPEPASRASKDELDGWRLFRRGYDRPPVRVLRRWLENGL
jgi:hypothetical protein